MMLVAKQKWNSNSRLRMYEKCPSSYYNNRRVHDSCRDGNEEGNVERRKSLRQAVERIKGKACPGVDSFLEDVMDVVTKVLPLV